MRWPFVPRSRYETALAEIEGLRRRVLDTEARHDEVEDKRRRLARMLAEADAADRRMHDRNLELRRRLDECDTYREALAGVLGDDLDLTWEQIIAAAERTRRTAVDRQADYEAEKARADQAHTDSAEADRQAIEAWEQQVKDRTEWEPGTLRLIEGGMPRPTHPAVILRHALSRCQGLEARLAVAEGRRRGVGS